MLLLTTIKLNAAPPPPLPKPLPKPPSRLDGEEVATNNKKRKIVYDRQII